MEYLLFAGSRYYPSGGAKDLIKDFESVEEAMQWYNQSDDYDPDYGWANILRLNDLKTVKEFSCGRWL